MTMRIVVIDNIEWNSTSISDVDFNENQLAWSVSTLHKNFGSINEELEGVKDAILTHENAHCYLINIHCAIYKKRSKTDFERETWFQSQAGVAIYRELLNIYKDCSEKLQVAFFSPCAEKPEVLIRKKVENQILNHLEFLEVPFTWKQVQTKFEKYNKPVYNNASENLLAGYSLYNSQNPINAKVVAGNKKILFIDDQSNEWSSVFQEIFHQDVIQNLPYSNQDEFRARLANGQVENDVKAKLSQCQLVLSDFYLNENHDPSKWMNKENILSISGFRLFKSIRDTDKGKAIPFIMHTSSNKVLYYKVFDQNGVDDWMVKDIRVDATAKEKIDNYIHFKQTIEAFVDQYWIYERLQSIWEKIQIIKNNKNSKWWYSSLYDSSLKYQVNDTSSKTNKFTKIDIVSILESSWYAIRRYLNKEIDYENTCGADDDTEPFLASSICNNLGKVFEMLNVKSGIKRLSFLSNFIINVRNSASHAKDNKYFILLDAFICLEYLVHAFTKYVDLNSYQTDFKDAYIIKGIGNDDTDAFPCGLLWLYIQFYNHGGSKVLPDVRRDILKKRIEPLFKQVLVDNSLRDVWNERSKLSVQFQRTKHWHESTFVLNHSVDIPTLNENLRGQHLKILIPNSWQ